MPRRKIQFENGEYYHVYNRGVDKRNIVAYNYDILRFLESLAVFNTTERVRSIYEHSFKKKNNQLGDPATKLVEIVAFNILDNHFHLVLRQLVVGGISKFLHNFSGGYARYFNEKYERSGALFQGAFKAKHIDSDEYLNYVVAYVNLNHVVHQLGDPVTKWGYRGSLEQYLSGDKEEWKNKYFECNTKIVLSRFKDGKSYLKDAIDVVNHILKKRYDDPSEFEFFAE